MPLVKIDISEEERINTLRAIKQLGSKATAISKICLATEYSESRTRYIVEDMVQLGIVRKRITKKLGPKYIRYVYEEAK